MAEVAIVCESCAKISYSACGSWSGFLLSISSKADFDIKTGSKKFPPFSDTTKFLNCESKVLVSSLNSIEKPFSASAPICESILAKIIS